MTAFRLEPGLDDLAVDGDLLWGDEDQENGAQGYLLLQEKLQSGPEAAAYISDVVRNDRRHRVLAGWVEDRGVHLEKGAQSRMAALGRDYAGVHDPSSDVQVSDSHSERLI